MASDRPAEGYERTLAFLIEALETGRPIRDDWRDAVHDALLDIDKIVRRSQRAKEAGIPYLPDVVMDARLAVGSLVGIFLDEDESEALYLGGEEP